MDETLRISDSCIGCGQCVKVCIRKHLEIGSDRRVHEVESPYSCFRCGHCSAVCPKDAIRLISPPGDVQEILDGHPVPPGQLAELYRQRRSHRWFDRKCTEDEIRALISTVRYAPTAENSQAVEYAVVDQRFPQFMEMLAAILRSHTGEHPRLKQFVEYVDNGQKEVNNPFTWEGRQIIVVFARFPIDAIIPVEQMDLMAYSMGLGGFHSRWMLQAAENDPKRFMSFFPEVSEGLQAYAMYIVGHPRVKYRRTVTRDERKILWK